ncbi:MAG: RnfABCDGE type electron transport complex subunit D [Candidatus Levybacteria bacterium]|nr:RnfABCDGE type electron transport complex subunit D [Candidatus Levybacteria bacterium]
MFQKIVRTIEDFLNGVTMYRLMLYFLISLWLLVLVLIFLDFLPFDFPEFLISSAIILSACYLTNKFFSLVFKIPTNLESPYITALILIFIVPPAKEFSEYLFLILAGIVAMTSKYVLALHGKHIFNPAAAAVFITSILAIGYANWWIGNQWTLLPILIGGFLVIKKIKRFSMTSSFLITFFAATLLFGFLNESDLIKTIQRILIDSPILFFASVMLVEPLTSPTRKKMQIIYGLLVGILAGSQFSIGPVYSTYETALIIGNIFAYIVSFKHRLILTFVEKIKLAPNIFELVFSPSKKFAYLPGQYFEWTLSHNRPDSRGVRRYFTIASSPTEGNVRLGIKIDPQKGSSFKKKLLALEKSNKIYAGQLSGDFVLPKNKSEKAVFIAGGIGITPFRSIIKFLIDKKEKRDIVLFYSCSDPAEFVYKDIFEKAKSIGLKTVYVCSHPTPDWKGRIGRIDEKMIKEEVGDFKNRIYYLSGPSSMVNSYKSLIRKMDIKPHRIVTDYFPGY